MSPNHKYHENVNAGKVYVSHDVTNFEFLYEPFYVAKDIVPSHDERFMGYGYTRNTQVRNIFKTMSFCIRYLHDKYDSAVERRIENAKVKIKMLRYEEIYFSLRRSMVSIKFAFSANTQI